MSSIILKQHYQKLRESIIEDIRRVVKEHQEVEIEVEPVKKMMIKRLLVESVTGMGAILGDGELVPFREISIDELIELLEFTEESLKDAKKFLNTTQ